MEITWLGWDSFKVKTTGKTIYFDPVTGNCDEPADLVLISHSHADHSDLKILSKVRKAGTVVLTSKQNMANVNGIGLEAGESHSIDSLIARAVYAYNIVRMRTPGNPFHPKGFGVGWIIESEGKKIYHMGDTELVPEMENLPEIDIMLIPISGVYVMDIDEAVKAVTLIKPKTVIPMHYGAIDVVFGKGPSHLELLADPLEFERKLKGIANVVILKEGESIVL
jgi:L-ascorbate metabolism protein UlaG (beta-lactamase superfamily)